MPAFAISVPIGGYHPLLRDCLSSLAIQTPRPNVAFLDASGDPRVAAILDEFSGLAAYRRTGADGGQSDAIIEGWTNVDGDILGWLNADDALYPGALAEAAGCFQNHPETDVFYGHSVIIDDDFAIKGYHWAVEPPSENILSGGIISQPSCFFRRRLVDAVGGLDRDLHYTMDWDLWVRFWRAGANFRFTDSVMSRVLWSRDAKTGGFGRTRQKELERIIGANNSFLRRMKSRAGFALHHVFEYLAPDAVADAFRARRSGAANAIHGVDRTGRVYDRATLPIVHYDAAARTQIAVSFKEQTAKARIVANGATVAAQGPGEHRLPLATPARAGESLVVVIENMGSGAASLSSLRWA